MNTPNDPYWQLRPPEPTPSGEICGCPGRPPVVLSHRLGENPVHCFECNLEVPPERLGFGEDVAQELSYWNYLDGAMYRLWLDSEEYESWAVERLTDPHGRVNLLAKSAIGALNEYVRAYHSWFMDIDTQLSHCPRCRQTLEAKPTRVHPTRKVCEPCSVAVTDHLRLD